MTAQKVLVLGLVCLALVLPLAATAAPTTQAIHLSIEPRACDEPGRVTLWVWDEHWHAAIEQSVREWTARYCPGADVDVVQQPWAEYWRLIEAGAESDNLPDIFNMSQDRFRFYAEQGKLLDLQPYWDAFGVDTALWGTGLVDPYRWGSEAHLFAGPANWDTIALYYNKNLFDAARVPYPTADWTWEDFAAAAAALTDASAGIYGAAVYPEYQAGYTNWIAATDTTPIVDVERTRCTLTDEGSLEALNFLKALYVNGYMPSVSAMGGSSPDDAFRMFLDGQVAMVQAGPWKIPLLVAEADFDWDIAQLPRHPDTGISRPLLHAVGYVASANTANPDLVANLILYLVSDEAQSTFAAMAGVPPANPAAQDEWFALFGDTGKNIDAFTNALPDTQGITAFVEIWDAINTDLVIRLFDGDEPVDQVAQDICAFIESQLPE